jgi:hypothetical protein
LASQPSLVRRVFDDAMTMTPKILLSATALVGLALSANAIFAHEEHACADARCADPVPEIVPTATHSEHFHPTPANSLKPVTGFSSASYGLFFDF